VPASPDRPDRSLPSCRPGCTIRHGPDLLEGHGRTFAVITAAHAEVSVTVEQTGEHPPTLALSVHATDPQPHAAGFTHLSTTQARELRNALIAAVDILTSGHVNSAD